MSLEHEVLKQQRDELDEHCIYRELAKSAAADNRATLEHLAAIEREHYERWRGVSQRELSPRRWKVRWYLLVSRVLGLAFALKLMERREARAQAFYESVARHHPGIRRMRREEERRELHLLNELYDRKLLYAGAIVLGLNDALVELTGTLAGVSFAFQNSTLIGVIGIIMGVAASLSMAASGYLESRENVDEVRDPLRSATYTGIAYITTTLLLVFPYFVFPNPFVALGLMLFFAVLVILLYSYYVSVAKDQNFWKRTRELAGVSLGVAAISFAFGFALRHGLGIHHL